MVRDCCAEPLGSNYSRMRVLRFPKDCGVAATKAIPLARTYSWPRLAREDCGRPARKTWGRSIRKENPIPGFEVTNAPLVQKELLYLRTNRS
jgi:hypothetical protein